MISKINVGLYPWALIRQVKEGEIASLSMRSGKLAWLNALLPGFVIKRVDFGLQILSLVLLSV